MRPLVPALLLAAVVGCDEASPGPVAPSPPPPLGGQTFDPANVGAVEGMVRWEGPAPKAPPFRSRAFVNGLATPDNPVRDFANPNAPHVGKDNALAGAVVRLVGVEASRARPWPLPAVVVEVDDETLRVRQAGRAGHIAVVQAGAEVTFVSRAKRAQMVQGRGASFFCLALPQPVRERVWRLDAPGVVELRSGTNCFWMRAYLVVSDHPYVAVTRGDGTFRLEGVPCGEYEAEVSHPCWRVASFDRNPDNLRVWDVSFGAWIRRRTKVRVKAGEAARLEAGLAGSP